MITVISFQDHQRWFVHGINIDFCASGDTLDEAMIHFWAGLAMTFWKTQHEQGNVESVMRPPPREVIEHLEGLIGRPLASINQTSPSLQ